MAVTEYVNLVYKLIKNLDLSFSECLGEDAVGITSTLVSMLVICPRIYDSKSPSCHGKTWRRWLTILPENQSVEVFELA